VAIDFSNARFFVAESALPVIQYDRAILACGFRSPIISADNRLKSGLSVYGLIMSGHAGSQKRLTGSDMPVF
jgi:hypothetical protein